MGPEILSLRGGFPFLPSPLEQSFTVHTFCRNWARKPPLFSFWILNLSQMVCILIESKKWLSNAKDFWVLCNRLEVRSRIKSSILVDLVDFINVSQISKTQTAAFSSNMGNICSGGNIGHGWLLILAFKGMILSAKLTLVLLDFINSFSFWVNWKVTLTVGLHFVMFLWLSHNDLKMLM